MNLQELFFDVFKEQIVGGSVVVIDGNKEFKYNYGFQSLETKKLVSDETIYRIASISKVLISMAIMKLFEEGKIDLDADISNYLGYKVRNPKYPDSPITVRMLMYHTSSINDGLEDESIELGYNGVNGKHYFVSLKDLLTNPNYQYYTPKTYSDYSPGEKYLYSNFGMGILACIIEMVSGRLFTEFIEESFINPLNIDASFKASKIKNKDKISDTHLGFKTYRTAKSFIDNTYPDHPLGNNFRGPAGGLFISMQDLSKIMLALMRDGKYKDVELLKKETVDYFLNMKFFMTYQLKDKNIILKGHTGNAYGVRSLMFFSKEHDKGVCFIANGGKYLITESELTNVQEGVLKVFEQLF